MVKIQPDEPCPCGSGKAYRDCHQAARRPSGPVEATEHRKLVRIPEPDPGTRAVFERGGEGTVFFSGSETSISFECAQCDAPLVVGLVPGAFPNLVFRCASCGSYNEAPSEEQSGSS